MKSVSNISVGQTHSGTVTGAKGGGGSCFMKVGRTGSLCRFDVCKRHTLGVHLSPIDGFLPVRNIYALWSRQALHHWACNPSSSSGESRERDDKSESHAVWFCVGPRAPESLILYPLSCQKKKTNVCLKRCIAELILEPHSF